MGFGANVPLERLADLRRIFGSDVTVETIATPRAQLVIDRAKRISAHAVVFDVGNPDVVRQVVAALPGVSTYGVERQTVTRRTEIGRDERGQMVKGDTTRVAFGAYLPHNERGEIDQPRHRDAKRQVEQPGGEDEERKRQRDGYGF